MITSIIGGGPSGMFLAILVKEARPDFKVRLFERNNRVGKKLLGTGNGRCNYTNIDLRKENFHSENDSFPMEIINKFNNIDAIEKLKQYGIYPTVDDRGRVYPLSLQGSSVLDFLRYKMEKLGVEVILNEKIDKVIKSKEEFILTGSQTYKSDILVVATGGMAMPQSGSDGIGYRIGRELGHKIIEFGPTIVQLESDFRRIKEFKGVRIDTSARLYIDGQIQDEKTGDVLFTDYGLSGPAILDLSRKAIEGLKKSKKVEISINLLALEKEEIYDMILYRAQNLEGIEFEKFFNGIINKKIIQSFKEILLFKSKEKYDIITCNEKIIQEITNLLYDFRLKITGYKGFGNAQSTTGGIDTTEVDFNLESKLVNNLFFIGEVLDVDGDCGGYNLQWAWSSGYVAGNTIINRGR